jgi:hypothetical protein
MASFDARVKADLRESELRILIRADGRLSTVRIILIGLPGNDNAAWFDLSRETSREKCKTCSLRSSPLASE